MLRFLPDLLALLVILVIGGVIVGIPYSIFISLPRAFRKGLEEGCRSTNKQSREPNIEFEDRVRFGAKAEALTVLGLSSCATKAEIKAAYRKLVSEWHPDRLTDMATELQDIATQKLKRINQAYDVLIRSD